jgi:hypothetical protein
MHDEVGTQDDKVGGMDYNPNLISQVDCGRRETSPYPFQAVEYEAQGRYLQISHL